MWRRQTTATDLHLSKRVDLWPISVYERVNLTAQQPVSSPANLVVELLFLKLTS